MQGYWISDYQVVYGRTGEELEMKVKSFIVEGWQPLAGGFSVNDGYDQVMVKYVSQ